MSAAQAESGRLPAVATHAHRQHGVFTRSQATGEGLTRGMLDHRIRAGELVRVDHGVYRSVLTPPSWRQRLTAVCLAGPAVASHRSAGLVWQAPGCVEILEATALRHRRRTTGDVIWHESYLLDADQVTEVDGIPVTVPTRTVVDLGVVLDVEVLLRVIDDFTRRRLTAPERVARLVERLGPLRPGRGTVDAALARRLGPDAGATPESDLETVFDALIRSAGLPVPVRQLPVRLADGRTVRIDFAYPDARLAIEVMGSEFHAPPDQWAQDIERMNALGAVGYRVLPFTNRQVRQQPDTVVASIRAALDDRRAHTRLRG